MFTTILEQLDLYLNTVHQHFNMCVTPISVTYDKGGRTDTVPCGQCPVCARRRISGWSFRLLQQERISDSTLFITLTYDYANMPITKRGYKTLKKADVQNFIKALRYAQTGRQKSNIKYYAAGEYGNKTFRPHYHIIIFNAKIELIQKAWDKGYIHYGGGIGAVNAATIGYTLKYINKVGKIPLHKNDDRQKEFSLMSKGLGLNYLTPAMIKYHKADLLNRICIEYDGNKKAAMPRYYKTKIYTKDEKDKIKSHFTAKVQADRDRLASSPIDASQNEKAILSAFVSRHHNQISEQTKL